MKFPHFILEMANVHSGDKNKIIEMINVFSDSNYDNLGIKFQPLRYDKIALEDFEWYSVYKDLYLNEIEWDEIIKHSEKKFKFIWLDLFDSYGAKILKNNINLIDGIKIQASVIDNIEVFDKLSDLKLIEKKLIVNISGYTISKIEKIISHYQSLNVSELIIQIGFQFFPTDVKNTAINKISVLKSAFPENKICFADHISGEKDFAKILPSIAYALGCDYIEKHICLDRSKTKYDFHSSLEYDELQDSLNYLKSTIRSNSSQFISDQETSYLEKSIQKPLAIKTVKKGSLISKDDLLFRRTNLEGMSYDRINNLQSKFQILKNDIKADNPILENSFKKARIGVIIACRMKSSRLKKKAILPLNNISSLERCVNNTLMFPNVDTIVVATSENEEDKILKDYMGNNKVHFWQGSADDVISRYIGVCEYYGIDIIIRVTADCCLISPEIAEILLESHFSQGADFTATINCAVGSSPEIYNLNALKKVYSYFGSAKYSEYMNFYMRSNPNYFKLNEINLPKELIRDYRLTLDYKEDLDMFDKLYKKIEENNVSTGIHDVFNILDNNPSIANINSHLTLKYKTDKNLIKKLNKVTKIN